MNIEALLTHTATRAVEALFATPATGAIQPGIIQVQKTRREFEGDYTLVTFPLLKLTRKSPEQSAQAIGEWLRDNAPEVAGFNVITGFLNISLKPEFWAARFAEICVDGAFGQGAPTGKTLMVEYSSPNTNKPLHLGHIRNNLLGWSVAQILTAAGNSVIKANLVNDRGIHICKSMIAWQLYGNGETPQSSGMKGDHLAGKYYVEFDKHYKAEVKELIASGMEEEQAKREAPIMRQAQAMLVAWEENDPAVRALWERMNGWVYEGFEQTYKALGVSFDKMYYESQTYLLGKALVEEGLAKGVFYRRDDGSVWIDLTADGLDEKLLLRGDGTSVYMTQDLGTAYRRFADNRLDGMIYVVGNEQNYHFQVLKLILAKLGYKEWADSIFHLSYGMVELPEGKMKSREGTVVDADDLIAGMVDTAAAMQRELGKLEGTDPGEAAEVSRMVGLAALKYFILKVDPRKTMLFDPRESIDFNGNTGPFIQYTYARIRSLLRKAKEAGIEVAPAATSPLSNAAEDGERSPRPSLASASAGCGERPASRFASTLAGTLSAPAPSLLPEELELIKMLCDYPGTVAAAAAEYSPSVVAAYVYDLAKAYNGYYHDHSILREQNAAVRSQRLALSQQVARIIASGMSLLGIELPERM